MSRQTVSLVLGGGGARGLAHIGVIERLSHNGYEIRSISGSSMGALIGGVYAMGKLDVYRRWVCALERVDVLRLLDFSFGGNGLFKGERIIEVLKGMIGDRNIEDLPLAYTAVATDLESEQELWFSEGPLFDAIRASIAIPSIFRPHYYQGRYLLDGSLVNPVPIAPTLKDNTDLTIAVNLGAKAQAPIQVRPAPLDEQQKTADRRRIISFIDSMRQQLGQRKPRDVGLLEVVARSINIVENSLAQMQLASYAPDIVIEIPRNVCSFYEFYRAREVISIGRQKADEGLLIHQERCAH